MFPFHAIRLWELPAETFLNGPLGLLPFAPISRVNATEFPRVKLRIEERLAKEATRSQSETLRSALFQLLALRYNESEIGFWSDLMATLDISKTPLVKSIETKPQFARRKRSCSRWAKRS